MEKRGSGLTALCRGFIKALKGLFGACAAKWSKLEKSAPLYLRCPCLWVGGGGGCQNGPHCGGKRSWCQAVLSVLKDEVFVDGPVLLDDSAISCRAAPLIKHVFDTIPSSYLQWLLTAAKIRCASSHVAWRCCPLHPLSRCCPPISLGSSHTGTFPFLGENKPNERQRSTVGSNLVSATDELCDLVLVT